MLIVIHILLSAGKVLESRPLESSVLSNRLIAKTPFVERLSRISQELSRIETILNRIADELKQIGEKLRIIGEKLTELQKRLEPPLDIGHDQYFKEGIGVYAGSPKDAQNMCQGFMPSGSTLGACTSCVTDKIPIPSALSVFNDVNEFDGYTILGAKIQDKHTILHLQKKDDKTTYRTIINAVWQKGHAALWKKVIDQSIDAFCKAQEVFKFKLPHYDVAKADDIFVQLKELNGDNRVLKKTFDDVWTHYDKTMMDWRPIKIWRKQDIEAWRCDFMTRKDKSLAELVAVEIRATEITRGYKPRATQIASVLSCFLSKDKGQFLQVRTGEGKSLITVMLACAKHLMEDIPVDVISSSVELAKRDAAEQRDFYNVMGVSVGFVGDHDVGKYEPKSVVYSDIGILMGDELKEINVGKPRRGDRPFSALIVDELDSSLLDFVTTILRLSTTAPGAGTLVPILQLLWARLNTISSDLVFDPDLRVWIYTPSRLIVPDKAAFLQSNLTEFCTRLVDNSGHEFDLPIAENLKVFARYQIPQWVSSAITAFYMAEDTRYVYKTYDHKEPGAIKIVSLDTGVVEENLEWCNGQHQLTAIKHGGRVYPESVTGAFISKPAFLERYKQNIFGMTGTLGDAATRQFLTQRYPVSLFSVPPYERKQFEEYKAVVCTNAQEWEDSVIRSITQGTSRKRGVLVICETIKACNELKDKLAQTHPELLLQVYNRSDKADNKQAIDHPIREKEVILSTNLGGRGTDIPITKAVERNGGLHVVVTFVPPNERVEEQAFGRSARKGEPGSAQIVAQDEVGRSIEQLRAHRNKKEAKRIQCIEERLKEQGLYDALFKKVNDYMAGLRGGKEREDHPDKDKIEQLDFLWCMLYHRISHYQELASESYKKQFQSKLPSGLTIDGEIGDLLYPLSEEDRKTIIKMFLRAKDKWSDRDLKDIVRAHFDQPSPELFKSIAQVSGNTVVCIDGNGAITVYRGWRYGKFTFFGLSDFVSQYAQHMPDLRVLRDFYPQFSSAPHVKKEQFHNPLYTLSSDDGALPLSLMEVVFQKLLESPLPENPPLFGQKYDADLDRFDKILARYTQERADIAFKAESDFLHAWVDGFLRDMRSIYPDDEQFLFVSSCLTKRAADCEDQAKAMRLFARAIAVDRETFSVTGYKERADYVIKHEMPGHIGSALADLRRCSEGLEKLIQRWLLVGLFMGENARNQAVSKQIEQRIDSLSDMKATVDHNVETLSSAGSGFKAQIEVGQSRQRQDRVLSLLSTGNGIALNNLNKDQTETYELGLHNFNVYSLIPPKPKFWERAVMALVGVAQTVIGSVMSLSGVPFGFEVMMSGFQDIWAAAKSFVTETIDWGSFWMRKGVAALTSAVSHGYGAITGTNVAPTPATINKETMMRTIVSAGKTAFINTLISEVSTKAAKEIVMSFQHELRMAVREKVNGIFRDQTLADALLHAHFLSIEDRFLLYSEFLNDVGGFALKKKSQIAPIIEQITQACIGKHHTGLLSVVMRRMMDAIGYARHKEQAMRFVDEFIHSVTQRLRRLKDAIPPIKDVLMVVYRNKFHEELSPATADLVTTAMKAQVVIGSDRPYIVQLQPGFVPKDDIFRSVYSVGLPDTQILYICVSLFELFDVMLHYSHKRDAHFECEKNKIVELGTVGLSSLMQESVEHLVHLGINASRDVMNLFSAKLKEDLKKEEERARLEAERQEAIRLEQAAAEAKAAAAKVAAEKAAVEKLQRTFANPRIHLPNPQPSTMQPHLADVLAGHSPVTADLQQQSHIRYLQERAEDPSNSWEERIIFTEAHAKAEEGKFYHDNPGKAAMLAAGVLAPPFIFEGGAAFVSSVGASVVPELLAGIAPAAETGVSFASARTLSVAQQVATQGIARTQAAVTAATVSAVASEVAATAGKQVVGPTVSIIAEIIDRGLARTPEQTTAGTGTDYSFKSDIYTKIVQWKSPVGTYQEYKVYQRNDIDWDHIRTDGPPKFIGKTNREAALQQNLAPQLPDGKFVDLHHIGQDSRGALAEITTRIHSKDNPEAFRALHNQFDGKAHPEYPVDRSKFGSDRQAYWKWRAANE